MSYPNTQALSKRSGEMSKERQSQAGPPAKAIIDFIREGMQAANWLKRRRPEYLPPLVPDCGWDRGEESRKQRINCDMEV
jgi:hypothetical protein